MQKVVDSNNFEFLSKVFRLQHCSFPEIALNYEILAFVSSCTCFTTYFPVAFFLIMNAYNFVDLHLKNTQIPKLPKYEDL